MKPASFIIVVLTALAIIAVDGYALGAARWCGHDGCPELQSRDSGPGAEPADRGGADPGDGPGPGDDKGRGGDKGRDGGKGKGHDNDRGRGHDGDRGRGHGHGHDGDGD